MPKILQFPRPSRWKLPSIGRIGAGEELRLIVALDPPVALSRKLLEAQKALRPQAEKLRWLDPRDFILPVVEIPRARSEAIEAVDARMRACVQEGPRGRLVARGLQSAITPEEDKLWVSIEDPEGLLSRLAGKLSPLLVKDGFEVKTPPPKIVLAETREEADAPISLGGWASRDFGPFHVWDLVLYLRRAASTEISHEAISFVSLGV